MTIFATTESPNYPARTFFNAKKADLTVAFAVDFTTAGEKLTARAAGMRYVQIPLDASFKESTEAILNMLIRKEPVLNIAGNGIYTLHQCGWVQSAVNLKVYNVLKCVHKKNRVRKILTGGQTGVDWAGAVAATVLDIPCLVTFPAGFRQRSAKGVEVFQNETTLTRMLDNDVKEILNFTK